MRSLEEVRTELLAALAILPSETVPLVAAAGRVLAVRPRATINVPPADIVAMDGYAVRAADLREVPSRLNLIGRVVPGQSFAGHLDACQAVRVFTGAPLPVGADAVLMQEDTSILPESPGCVQVGCLVKPWENVRFRGEDVALGEELLNPGVRLGPAQLGLLAAAGVASVAVRLPAQVGILVTGSELVSTGQPLRPGQIYESNSLMLSGLIGAEGAEVKVFPFVADRLDALESALREAWSTVDLLVTSGGASVGEPDLVRAVIKSMGGQVYDGEVAMKPGKPFFRGQWQERTLLGLPGNPVSAFVTAVLLVLPAVRKMQGAIREAPPTTPATLLEELVNGDARRHFVRVVTGPAGKVRSAGVQASNRLKSLAAADGLVEIPPQTVLPAGAWVDVIRWGEAAG